MDVRIEDGMLSVLGLDVGGANLKGAHSSGVAYSLPFALWRSPTELPDALRRLLHHFPAPDLVALTMTGELCDCFERKADGVRTILQAVQSVIAGPLRVFTTLGPAGLFVTPDQALDVPLTVAAANWLALASFAGRWVPQGPALLLDIGSTTTDIVPLFEGRPVPTGRTDRDRLVAGELLYLGVRRTPLCALRAEGLAAEWFATTLDVHLLLGNIPSDPSDRDTADGRPATVEYAHARLARMFCADLDTSTEEDRLTLARQLNDEQLARIHRAVRAVGQRLLYPLSRDPESNAQFRQDRLCYLLSGSGEFLAQQALAALGQHVPLSISKKLGSACSSAACAYAVAKLAEEAHVCSATTA